MWQRIGPNIEVSQPLAALRDAYARTDIVALDLDECLFPGYSQVALGERIAWRLLRRPERARDRRFLPRLGLGGAYFALREAWRAVGTDVPTRRLLARYEWVMRGIPEHYFPDAAGTLPGLSYALAEETVAELAAHAPAGIVTLGLDVVARAFVERFRGAGGQVLSFFEANVVSFGPSRGGEGVFERYDPKLLMLSGADKRRALERRMGELGRAVPMTIGHNEHDVSLARFARERGGLAVGFRPPRGLWDAFDAVVTGLDWEPMYALVAILSGARRPAPGGRA